MRNTIDQAILQNAVAATGDGTAMPVMELSTAVFQVTGSFSATVNFEGTIDQSTWVSILASNTATGALATTATAAGIYVASVNGMTKVRARVAWTSGTSVTVTCRLSSSAGSMAFNDVEISSLTGALPAGTNNIGDVDIASVTTKSLTQVTGTKAASGDQTLVSAPGASTRIVVVAFVVQNEASTAQTIILGNGTASAAWRCFAQNQGDGLALVFKPGFEWRLTANTLLNLNLSAATTVGYSIAYYTEAT